jgi:alkylated DNA repair dioxygenase AlkB
MAQPLDTVLYSQPGAELRTRSFMGHKDTISQAVKDATPKLLKRPKIVVRGGEVSQPRDVAFFSDASTGYLYSNRIMEAQPLSDAMRDLLKVLNAAYGVQFNGFLINCYRDGKDSVGAHGDKEDGLDTAAGVVIISWGVSRKFRLRHNRGGTPLIMDVPTKHGHALQMHGARFQRELLHEIPKELRVLGTRFSITARKHLPQYEAMLTMHRARAAARARREAEEAGE